VSPREGRAAFLGVWRLASDLGNSGGPLVLGAVTAIATLATGVWVVGAAGLVGALAMYRWAPRRVGDDGDRQNAPARPGSADQVRPGPVAENPGRAVDSA
jgi:hypothetical protein